MQIKSEAALAILAYLRLHILQTHPRHTDQLGVEEYIRLRRHGDAAP